MKNSLAILFFFSLFQFSFVKKEAGYEYTGWIVRDGFGSFYLYNGCYVCPISKKIKNQFANFVNKPVSVQILKSTSYMNPGNERIDSVGKIKIISPDSLYHDNLNLTLFVGEMNDSGKVEISFALKNSGNYSKLIQPDQLTFIITSLKPGKPNPHLFYPDDDTSITVQDRQFNYFFRMKEGATSEEFSKEETRVSHIDLMLKANDIYTEKIFYKLSDGTYCIWAGYGDLNFGRPPCLKSKNAIEFRIANGKSEIISQ